jgi:TatD DNase family protein
MAFRLFDAHNHLQDERLGNATGELLDASRNEGVIKMVVNGSCEADWEQVLALARKYPEVVPSFGYHPWYIKERSPKWQQLLRDYLNEFPAGIGEIGLDRWINDYDIDAQREVFIWQLRLAAEKNVPVSIHCLKAWGMLLEILQNEPRPHCGFVLHSFGGPGELIPRLAELGGYFSFPGYFAQARKIRQRETFKSVPLERLLIETDAPDQALPPELCRYPLPDSSSGKTINHPANLPAVYHFVSELLGQPMEKLASQVEQNFWQVFGGLNRSRSN